MSGRRGTSSGSGPSDGQSTIVPTDVSGTPWPSTRGGSGLTQQLAKNLFGWPGRSYVRKALELPLALWIDLVIPKRRSLVHARMREASR
jgi:hypothetical protein